MIFLLVFVSLLALLCFFVSRANDVTEVRFFMKKYICCVLMCFVCLTSVAFAEEDAEETISPSPTADESPLPDEEEAAPDDAAEDGGEEDVYTPVDTPESDSLSGDTDDTPPADSGDTAGNRGSVLNSVPPVVTPSGSLMISAQPQNAYCDSGDYAAFVVTPSGGTPPYSYQWQYKLPDDEYWTDVEDGTNRVLTVSVEDDTELTLFRCFVSDSEDDMALTKEVTLYVGIPEVDENVFRYEMLTTLGEIYGIVIFFCVVVLCIFVYKFFRIFF